MLTDEDRDLLTRVEALLQTVLAKERPPASARLSVEEFARRVGVSAKTVRQWCRERKVKAAKFGEPARSGAKACPWRIPESEVERLLSCGGELSESATGPRDLPGLQDPPAG